MGKVSFFFLVFAAKILFQSFLAVLLAQIKKIKIMPLANGSSSLLTNHGNRTLVYLWTGSLDFARRPISIESTETL